MARNNVDTLQSEISSIVDQDEDTSAITADDYSLRLKYLNIAHKEWAEIADWQALYTEYNMLVSTSTGNASIALPNDFRKVASFAKITYDGTNTEKYGEVKPEEDSIYAATDKRFWVLGSPQGGYVLRVFGSTLASGASVKFPYYRSPISLVSPANIPDIPNTDFLVQRVVAHIWEAREDSRFPQAKADAERILANLLEFEQAPSRAYDDRVKTSNETRFSFRIGEN